MVSNSPLPMMPDRPSHGGPLSKKLLTRHEAAVVTSLSVRSIDRLIASGRLKVIKFGKSVRIPPASIDQLIAEETGVAN